MTLSKEQLVAYGFELRDTTDAALFHLEQLEQAADKWVATGTGWIQGGADSSDLAMLGPLQQAIFDSVEAFLAAYARTSLLVFPIAKAGFSAERGQAIQTTIGVDSGSPLANREFRDSWMHHDERLDAVISSGKRVSGQRFALAREIDESMTDSFLRVFAVDTRKIHYRKRDGSKEVADLKQLKAALQDLDVKRKALF